MAPTALNREIYKVETLLLKKERNGCPYPEGSVYISKALGKILCPRVCKVSFIKKKWNGIAG